MVFFLGLLLLGVVLSKEAFSARLAAPSASDMTHQPSSSSVQTSVAMYFPYLRLSWFRINAMRFTLLFEEQMKEQRHSQGSWRTTRTPGKLLVTSFMRLQASAHSS